jgi:hypothetical protein
MKACSAPRGNDGGAAALVAAAASEGQMKPVNLVAKLAAAETELACLKMALAQVKGDRGASPRSTTGTSGRRQLNFSRRQLSR